MKMIIDDLIKAQNGDILAGNKIIQHYSYYIYYLMSEYQIENKADCYDLAIEKILKTFYKFKI